MYIIKTKWLLVLNSNLCMGREQFMWEWSRKKIQFLVKRNPRKREGGNTNTRSTGSDEVYQSQSKSGNNTYFHCNGTSQNVFWVPMSQNCGGLVLQCFRASHLSVSNWVGQSNNFYIKKLCCFKCWKLQALLPLTTEFYSYN